MQYARDYIARVQIALARSSCDSLYTSLTSYCRAGPGCDLINYAQSAELAAEAWLTGWQALDGIEAVSARSLFLRA
jgi:hypothetical protein